MEMPLKKDEFLEKLRYNVIKGKERTTGGETNEL